MTTRRATLNVEVLEGRSLPTVTPVAVASGITHSFENDYRYTVQDYQSLLHRTPSVGEASGWAVQMEAGLSEEQFDAILLNSAEYHNAHGFDGPVWIANLYQDMLGRTPGGPEVNGWLNQLAHGMTPAQVANAFATSAERLTDRVVFDYGHYLGRAPAPAEVANWVSQLEHGLTDQDMVTDFTTSFEYYNVRYGGDNATWVAHLYLDVLGRAPTEGEVDTLVTALNCPPPANNCPNPPDNSDSGNNDFSGNDNSTPIIIIDTPAPVDTTPPVDCTPPVDNTDCTPPPVDCEPPPVDCPPSDPPPDNSYSDPTPPPDNSYYSDPTPPPDNSNSYSDPGTSDYYSDPGY